MQDLRLVPKPTTPSSPPSIVLSNTIASLWASSTCLSRPDPFIPSALTGEGIRLVPFFTLPPDAVAGTVNVKYSVTRSARETVRFERKAAIGVVEVRVVKVGALSSGMDQGHFAYR
jgi:hypothetical protein